MANQDHADKLEEGVAAWNAWRGDNLGVVPDLSIFDFRDRDLTDADLSEVNFGAMDVTGTIFRQANLRDAQLTHVQGLLPSSLAGADLTRAELPPEQREFPALEHVAEVSRHARVNFLAVVTSCVFCWLTIAQTADGSLIANRGAMSLPVIDTNVPVTGFFLFAPAILLALYVYVKQREQFGQPIGKFQALQHRLVDLFVQQELSRNTVAQTAAIFDETTDPVRRAGAVSAAKARCSDAGMLITKQGIQLHGGIGYTEECDIGLFLKRALVLSSWLGNAAAHRGRFAENAPLATA